MNAIGPYSSLLTNKAVAWGNCVDFIRKTVKYTLKEAVPLPTVGTTDTGSQTAEWLELGPDDISDIPCIVTVDPTSDLEKIALAKHFGEGVAGGFVPPRILQEQAYGADDPAAWDEEIIRAQAKRMYGQQMAALAFQELMQEVQATQEPPMIYGPNGQPISSSDNPTGLPRQARPSTIGRENTGGQGGSPAGQMPPGQPSQQAQQYAGGPPA